MSIVIQKRGVLDTIQDLGRRGFRKYGVNPNGAMDKTAVRLINTLLGNNENESVIEMHFPTPVFEFRESVVIAIGGGDFSAQIGDKDLANWSTHFVEKGSLVKFIAKKSRARCYLAIKGGFAIEKWLDSKSTNLKARFGGIEGRYLISTDEILFNKEFYSFEDYRPLKIARSIIPKYSKAPVIRAIAGAEYRKLTALSESVLLKESFEISNSSDRMGFRLRGKPLSLLNETELLSTAVDFGTVQLLPDGQMIVLMADHQTTGGYPKIAHVIKQDLPLLAQLNAGDEVRFEIVSIEQAEKAALQFEKDLRFLKMGLRFSSSKNK